MGFQNDIHPAFPRRTCFPLTADEFLETYTPLPSKPEPSHYPAPAAFDLKVDRKLKFPVLLLDNNACNRSRNNKS